VTHDVGPNGGRKGPSDRLVLMSCLVGCLIALFLMGAVMADALAHTWTLGTIRWILRARCSI